MILQTKAPSLIALMAKESRQGSHLRAVCDAILLARAEAELLPLPNTISNDRTTLPHQK